MGRGIIESGLFRSERYEVEQRTSDPAVHQEGDRWIRTDLAPETDQIATYRFDMGSQVVDFPIYDTAASVDGVVKVRRVQVNGTTGFIPFAESNASYPEWAFQHNGKRFGAHDSLEATVGLSYTGNSWSQSDLGLSNKANGIAFDGSYFYIADGNANVRQYDTSFSYTGSSWTLNDGGQGLHYESGNFYNYGYFGAIVEYDSNFTETNRWSYSWNTIALDYYNGYWYAHDYSNSQVRQLDGSFNATGTTYQTQPFTSEIDRAIINHNDVWWLLTAEARGHKHDSAWNYSGDWWTIDGADISGLSTDANYANSAAVYNGHMYIAYRDNFGGVAEFNIG